MVAKLSSITETEAAGLLSVRNLRTHFKTPLGIIEAVDGVNLEVRSGDVLGIVGESGCGKSVLALSVLRLLPVPPAVFAGGEIFFKGKNLLQLSETEMRKIRGNAISMVFQEPMAALNPVFTVGTQMSEVFRVHQKLSRSDARAMSVEMLKMVGVPSPENRMKEYPHQLSGGMCQRVMIAMALACRPDLLIADEPTTALDVTIQAQILDLMERLRRELGGAIVMITHDLGVIAEISQRVVVIYAGKTMEEASTVELFDNPLHPYTRGLMQAIPSPDVSRKVRSLYEIQGTVPSLLAVPPGCRFHPRCPYAETVCKEEEPLFQEITPGHRVACWRAGDV